MRAGRVLVAAACCALTAAPFLVVRFPPITDLPQHAAQIRLLQEALADPQSGYLIQWWTPYSLAYAVLGAAWAVFGAVDAGRVAALAIATLWVLAVHVLAAGRSRPLAAAALASVLCFNHVLYWGFLSFAIGWPAFVLWFLLATRQPAERGRWGDAPLFLLAGLLLYASHILWLAVGVVWFFLAVLARRPPLRQIAPRLLGLAPALLLAAIWYPQLGAQGFVSETVWATLPTGRLSFSWLVEAALGGLAGALEYWVMLLLALWAAASLWQSRGRLREAVDVDLLLAAGLLGLLVLILPDKQTNTIHFASRWAPPATVLLLLALPCPRSLPRLQVPLAASFYAVVCLSTAMAWMRFERVELTGLSRALAEVPSGARVLGLDFVNESRIVRGRPFLQMFAYAQVLRGARLNFSFAAFAPSLVVYDEPRAVPWTVGLEWFPERVRPSDLEHFDYVLVQASDEGHAAFRRDTALRPETAEGRWRLYRSDAAERRG